VNSDRRFDGGAWLTLAVVAAWAVIDVVLALAGAFLPSDGWVSFGPDRDGRFRFEMNLTGQPSPLAVGDVVTAIDGWPLTAGRTPELPERLEVGDSIHYTVQRGDALVELEVTLVRPGLAGMGRGLAWLVVDSPRDLLTGGLSLLVAAIAFAWRPGNLGARYLLLIFSFYFFGLLAGFALPGLYTYAYPLPLALLYNLSGPWVWGWYFFPSLTLMALAFPVVKAPLRRFPRLLPALLYGVPLAVTAYTNYAALATGDQRRLDALTPVISLTGLSAIAALFGTLIHNWLTLRDPVARAQLRWLALGLGGLGVMFSISATLVAVYGRVPDNWNNILWMMLLLPLSLAIAITRYRLFDIDVIIRRTLIYSALSAVLVLVYFGSVIVIEGVLRGATGGGSPLAIVLSTLAIAALFVPLRTRVQRAIDRRFYRRKYDAARTLAGFGASARDETNLAHLTERLLGVVDETMQPEHVGLWVRPGAAGQRGENAPQPSP
jgi:hypothetical protein